MTDIEQNKTIVRDMIDSLFTRGDADAVDEYLGEGFVWHDPSVGGLSADREGVRTAAALIRAAFPDWHSDLHMLVGESDIVVERFTASGSHQGEFLGVAPTGRTVTLRGINIFRITDGRVVEWWSRLDTLGMLSQLGLVDAGLLAGGVPEGEPVP